MGYNIAGSGMKSAVCRALMQRYGADMSVEEHVEATMVLETQNAFLEQDAPEPGGETVGRPYLVLVGRVVELQGEFPYDISTVRFAEVEERPSVTYRYELTRENMVELCRKGMFEPGFSVPDVIRNNDFELPCTVSCAALAPGAENEPPVIFADIDFDSLECDDEMSGYTIDEYFEAVPRQPKLYEDEAGYEPERFSGERAAEILGVDAPAPELVDGAVPPSPDVSKPVDTRAPAHVPAKPARSTVRPEAKPSRTPRGAAAQQPAKPAPTPVQPAADDGLDLDLGDDYV